MGMTEDKDGRIGEGRCGTLAMTSVHNAVDSQGHGLLSTFKHHAPPAADWSMVPKEAHPHDVDFEKKHKRVLKKQTDPHVLHHSQAEVRECVQIAGRLCRWDRNHLQTRVLT